ncbi:hypothetical protein GCM10009677_61830 [Sphaerisporangium rubeum]|uniref:Phage holin family protein n=1 Tax=Sphaerisporangium rubeum TaxID=321317 RepID=A0A7X0IA25_9ACTN|nr:hypothetical protein [Sphaerisporangium rubeum]MBB6471397.1 hypothetical protein [Sphaerisporangium rubeum]
MSIKVRRGVAAAGTVAIAAAVNVATGMLTQQWDLAWWIAIAALVVIGGVIQAWLTIAEPTSPPIRTQSISNTRVNGSAKQIMNVSGEQRVSDSDVGGDLSQSQ